ncbi:retron St85 family effector protein [Serratia fonticola]|uniref:retron St85 family effector protein n=2 Tax=Serratia fonticola TaxID=47917 RepID=UPI0034C5BFDF
MDDIRDNFLLCVDPTKLRLKNLPNFVFICGGIRHDVDNPRPGSMRDALLRRLSETDLALSERIKEAEEFQDWLEHSHIDNLIDFEIVLADLASAVILVVEGLGAYAELGAFSVIESISNKLITIVNTNTLILKSFINLGVIKYLEDNSRTILRYGWNVEYIVRGVGRNNVTLSLNGTNEEIHDKADIILDRLKQEVNNKTRSSAVFNKDIKGHVCLAIAELIFIFSALKLNEIKKYLHSGFNIDLPIGKIKEYLYTLEKLDITSKENAGDVYYVATSLNEGFIKYRYFDERDSILEFSDANEIKAKMILFYRTHDASRASVINN